MVRSPGAVVFGRVEGNITKLVLVRVVKMEGDSRRIYLFAIPCDEDHPKAQRVAMTGGDDDDSDGAHGMAMTPPKGEHAGASSRGDQGSRFAFGTLVIISCLSS